MIRKLPHCSPRGWPAILSSPALGRPSGCEGDRAAAPRGSLRDRLDCALPGCAITYDRVENRQQLAGDRDSGDFLGLAGCSEALEKGLNHGVGPPGHHGAQEQGCAHTRPAAADDTPAPPLCRVTREGRKANKRGDLLAVEGPKFRQLSNERARYYRPDTEPGGNRVEVANAGARLVLAPDWQPITWTEEERKKGQAWGLKTIDSFHTHGTPPLPGQHSSNAGMGQDEQADKGSTS